MKKKFYDLLDAVEYGVKMEEHGNVVTMTYDHGEYIVIVGRGHSDTFQKGVKTLQEVEKAAHTDGFSVVCENDGFNKPITFCLDGSICISATLDEMECLMYSLYFETVYPSYMGNHRYEFQWNGYTMAVEVI